MLHNVFWPLRACAIACSLMLSAFPTAAAPRGAPSASSVAPVEWPVHGLTPAEQRFSGLAEIDTHTIGRLGLVWYRQFDTDRGQEATPLMVGGVLYVSTAWSKVVALDAVTGAQLWAYDPKVSPGMLARTCCDAVNRGVAVAHGKVFVATLDGRLVALDARTGKPRWSTMTVDPARTYSSTGAPRVIGNKVLIGNSGAEFGVRGYVSAYDTGTGKRVWRFYTTPNPDDRLDGAASDRVLGQMARPTWFGQGWKVTGGGGTVWDAMAYDPESGLLYIGTGNGSPHNHLYRSDGKGDNLFLSSIIALRPETGEYVWHYQTTPGDSWDYTATQPIILADIAIGGKLRKVLMQAPKNGFFYVLDRVSGELISATPYTALNWATGVDAKSGRPIEVAGARYTDKPWFQMPGSLGAHSWHPMAYSPRTGLVYIPVQEIGQGFETLKGYRFRPGHMNTGQDLLKLSLPEDEAEIAKMRGAIYGRLVAWDPVAGKARWSVRQPTFVNGGVLATAGGLVFQGTAEAEFKAYDAATGQQLWTYPTGNGVVAPPITYRIGGRQYVAVLVGYGGAGPMLGTIVPERPRLPGRLLVFALDGAAKAPDFAPPAPAPANVAGEESHGDPIAGLALFNDTCMVCHGFSAASGWNADLRRSAMLGSREAWRSVVIDGALKTRGMAGFGKYLTAAQAEDIRAYVRTQAAVLARREATR